MSELAILKQQLPAYLSGAQPNQLPNELEESVRASFAVVSVKGKVFAIKFGGETQQILNKEGYPAQYIDVVLVSANAHLNKTYYATTFNDDAAERPDCWSDDGVKPSGANPVHSICATCPKNQFGSRISDNGSKGKACQDNRKVVVLPHGSLTNEKFGGGMLLRISPTGLQELQSYSRKLRASNVPYYAVVTRLSFDAELAYPKLTYTPVGYLNEAEFNIVLAARESEHTKHILESSYVEAAEPEDTFSTMGAVPAHIQAAPEPAPAPAEAPKRTRTRATAPAPVVEAPVEAAATNGVVHGTIVNDIQVPESLSNTLSGLFG